MTLASVPKLAIVGVCALLRASRIVGPQLPVSKSTKLGTLPAAIRSCSGEPLMVASSMNCACVTTDAMVVNSLMVTRAGGLLPTTAISAIAGLSPAP